MDTDKSYIHKIYALEQHVPNAPESESLSLGLGIFLSSSLVILIRWLIDHESGETIEIERLDQLSDAGQLTSSPLQRKRRHDDLSLIVFYHSWRRCLQNPTKWSHNPLH